jgi:regulatory protein
MQREKSTSQSIHEYALNLLSQRAYTTRALERKLFTKGFEKVEIAREIESLHRSRLLDDKKFAREYARQKLTTGGKSVRRVQLELVHKGIASGDIKVALDAVLAEESVDTRESLRRAGEKKLMMMSGLEPMTQRKRLIAYLARRGFEIDDIRIFVNSALG